MKKLILVSCLSLTSFSVFALPGIPSIYVGIQGGYFNGHTFSNSELGVNSSNTYGVSIDGDGVRGYIGYDWNAIIGTEIGYAHFSGSNSIADNLGQIIGDVIISPTGTSYSSNTDLSQNTVDALAKIKFPIPFIHPYIKAGIAYVNTDLDTKVTVSPGPTQTFSKSTSSIMPVIGAGLESNIFAGLSIDAGWMRYQHIDTNTEDTDFFMMGLSYDFG